MSKANKPPAEGNQDVNYGLGKVGRGFANTCTVKLDLTRLAKIKSQEMDIYKDQVTIRSENIVREILKSFTIKNRKSLKSLGINVIIGRFAETMDRSLNFFLSEIAKKFPDLQRLAINFKEGSISENRFAMFITQVSRHFASLKRLTLSFQHFHLVKDLGIKFLGSEISKNIPNLQQLGIQFEFGNITNNGIEALASNISRNLIHLKNLSLNLQRCPQINTKNIKAVFSKISPGLPNLKQLSLTFSDYQESDKGFGVVASELVQHLIQLRSLSLDVWFKPLTNKTLITLTSTLATQLSSLRELSLQLAPCASLTDKGITALGGQIANLANLHKFALKFIGNSMTNTKITDKGAQALISAITDNLINLEDFAIALPYSKITDSSIKTIGYDVTRKLDNLRCLSLDLHGCKRVTTEAIGLLVDELAGQRTPLIGLSLYLNPSITDTSLQTLIDKVCEGLVGLNKLDFKFYQCHKITNAGIDYLAGQIKERLINLEDLTLTLEHMNDHYKQGLKEMLEPIPNRMIG